MSLSNLRTDFVRVKSVKSLDEAITYIQDRKKTLARVPVTVFQSCMSDDEINEIDLAAHLRRHTSIQIHVESANVISPGIHQTVSNTVANKQLSRKENKKYLKELSDSSNEYLERYENESDNEYGLRIFAQYFKDSVDKKHKVLYARDSLIPPNGTKRLNLPKSTLNVKVKGDLNGINSPMWYVSGPGSVTSWHNEDGDQPSINLCLSGKHKIYAFIPHKFSVLLADRLHEYLGSKCAMFHKPGVIVDPTLLQKWNIPVQFYVQKPGDMIYIGEAVSHCVINNGLSIAEAINFGTELSVNRSSLTAFCKCDRNTRNRDTVEELLERPIVPKNIPRSKKEYYQCDVANCIAGKDLTTKVALIKHNVEVHNCKPFQCENVKCGKNFMTKRAMQKHYQTAHESIDLNEHVHENQKASSYDNATEVCPHCDKLITKSNMNRHVNDVHGEERVFCDLCGIKVLKRCMPKHLTTCEGPSAESSCNICDKSFSAPKYLKMHLKTHKKIVTK